MPPRYDRILKKQVEEMLLPGGPFDFLITKLPFPEKDPYALDIQLRQNNEVMYYHGTTRLLVLTFNLRSGEVQVVPSADEAYGKYPLCSPEYKTLMKLSLPKDVESFQKAIRDYLSCAINASNSRYYKNRKEGYWQNRLCVRYGKMWRPGDEWLIIDRESVIGFDDKEKRKEFYELTKRAFSDVRNRLQQNDSSMWGLPKDDQFGPELDLLAINKTGHLAIIELKHGSSIDGIYWGPLQTRFYHQAFANVIKEVSPFIKELALQKVRLGLLPAAAEQFIQQSELAQVEPILAIANPNERSSCWSKMNRVLAEMKIYGLLKQPVPLRVAKLQGFDGLDIKYMEPSP